MDKRPFKSDPPARLGNIVTTGIQHILDLIAFIDWHDRQALIIFCGVERDGQVDLALFIRKTPDLRDQAHGRDGEAPRPKVVIHPGH